MGSCTCCNQLQTEQTTERIIKDQELTFDDVPSTKQPDDVIHEIAIFGTSRSGKTCLLNQMNELFSDPKFVLRAIQDIRQNCVDNISILCEMIDDELSGEILYDLDINNMVDLPNIAGTIYNVWKQSLVKVKYEYRHFYGGYSLNDNMDYFFNKIYEIMDIQYYPSADDIIRHKSTNSSITSITIPSNQFTKNIFKLSDAGTVAAFCQLHNKQWHIFDKAACIIYMVDLSGYCCEDLFDSNALRESLRLFEILINSRYFKRSTIMVVFNKYDIFKQCIKNGILLQICFPDYNGPSYLNLEPLMASFIPLQMKQNTGWKMLGEDITHLIQLYLYNKTDPEYFKLCYDQALKYIKQRFENIHSKNHCSRNIYHHVCNALDIENTKKMFNQIQYNICCD